LTFCFRYARVRRAAPAAIERTTSALMESNEPASTGAAAIRSRRRARRELRVGFAEGPLAPALTHGRSRRPASITVRPTLHSVFHSRKPRHILGFSLQMSPTTNIRLYDRTLLDVQEIETPRVDISRCSQFEDARKKENTGGKHRPDPQADRGCYPAKGIQSRIVTRLASLKSRSRGVRGDIAARLDRRVFFRLASRRGWRVSTPKRDRAIGSIIVLPSRDQRPAWGSSSGPIRTP
jgi:hypothetical protein